MRGAQTPDYYQLLGVKATASYADIKARYRALSKQHHPDVGGSQAHMATINHAYAVLSDKFKRAIYDAERRRTLALAANQHTAKTQHSPVRPATVRNRTTKKRSAWWPRLAWGFAALVILIGMLLHLPIAEAITPAEPANPAASKPLDVTYPPDYVASSPTFYTAPDGTEYTAPAVQPTKDDKKSEPKTKDRDCTTKSYGPYQRTVCRSEEGNKVCSTSTLGSQRFGDCD